MAKPELRAPIFGSGADGLGAQSPRRLPEGARLRIAQIVLI